MAKGKTVLADKNEDGKVELPAKVKHQFAAHALKTTDHEFDPKFSIGNQKKTVPVQSSANAKLAKPCATCGFDEELHQIGVELEEAGAEEFDAATSTWS